MMQDGVSTLEQERVARIPFWGPHLGEEFLYWFKARLRRAAARLAPCRARRADHRYREAMAHAHELVFDVQGLPPSKNEALSLFAQNHQYAARVVTLLSSAQRALTAASDHIPFASKAIGLEVTLAAPSLPPSDATNYLGGIGDVLEDKRKRGLIDHLGALRDVALYDNDRQIQEVHYRWVREDREHYTVRLWALHEST